MTNMTTFTCFTYSMSTHYTVSKLEGLLPIINMTKDSCHIYSISTHDIISFVVMPTRPQLAAYHNQGFLAACLVPPADLYQCVGSCIYFLRHLSSPQPNTLVVLGTLYSKCLDHIFQTHSLHSRQLIQVSRDPVIG